MKWSKKFLRRAMLEISWDGRCVHTGDGASIESQSQAEADLNKLILTILRTEKTKNVYVCKKGNMDQSGWGK
jgi:hypothetical protein